MKFLSKFFGKTPSDPPAPSAPRARNSGRQSAGGPIVAGSHGQHFEALTYSDARSPIRVGMVGGAPASTAHLRERLSAISHYLFDNYGMVAHAVETIVNYCTPLYPQANTPNRDWNARAEALFETWSRRSDFTGRFSFESIQRMMCRSIDLAGDVAPLLTTESGLPQLQLIESWRIKGATLDGVVTDSKGRVSGYAIDAGQIISGNEMRLMYDPDRYSNYRGMSALRRGMNDIRDAHDIKTFEKMAVKIASALPAYMEGAAALEENVWGNNTGTGGDTPGSGATEFDKKVSIFDLVGGDIPTMPTGTKIVPLKNERSGANVLGFIDELVGHFVAGLGIPPAFFLDGKLTGPNQRAVNGKAQRRFDARIDTLSDFVIWLWPRVIGWYIERGEIEAVPGWDACKVQGPAKISIDAGREMKQERDDVASGLMTRRDHYGRRSLDWQRETDQGLAEDEYIIERARALADKHGLPMATILARYGFFRPLNAVFGASENGQTQAPNQEEETE